MLGRGIRPLLAVAVFVTAVVSLSADLAAPRSAPDTRARRVSELVGRHRVKGGPGLAVAVVQGSRVVHVSAHGIGRYLGSGLTVVVLSNDHGMSCGVLGGRIAELFAPPAAAG